MKGKACPERRKLSDRAFIKKKSRRAVEQRGRTTLCHLKDGAG